MPTSLLRRCRALLPVCVAAVSSLVAQGPPGGFAETFALATDRRAALAQLIPGTEEHYFYSCLLAQHEGNLGAVPALLRSWTEKHGRTQRVDEIELRQALLSYDADAKRTQQYLRDRLGLSFDQQQQLPGALPQLPTSLDPALVTTERLLQLALERHPNSVDGLRTDGLLALARADVPDALVRPLLERIDAPGFPGLVELSARLLQQRRTQSFDAVLAQSAFTLAQLLDLEQRVPRLRDDAKFVEACLSRMQPGSDVDLEGDDAARERWLDELEAFTSKLPAVHASLKAHVLHHRLRHEFARGRVDEARLEAYLRLPRQGALTNPRWIERNANTHFVVDGAQFATRFAPVGDDQAFLRDAFLQLFATADSYSKWSEFVREEWLRRIFAEAKLMRGEGDLAQWYSLLDDPSYYESFVQRVDLQFAPTQPRSYRAADPVTVELDVKNVPKLLVKLYRIDAFAYLVANGRPVDTSIDLDGVVANEERVVEYAEPPSRRVRRSFAFDAMREPGTYVVEFVGNGMSSRAVIQKGRLSVLPRVGAAGHVFTVVDENGEVVRDAIGNCMGREVKADEVGELRFPFAPQDGEVALVVRSGGVAAVHRFRAVAETARLHLGAFVEREALRGGERARLVVRPRLLLAGEPVPMELMTGAELEIAASTADGATALQTVSIAKWPAAGDYVHEFEAPRGLVSLRVLLRGSFRSASTGQTVQLEVAEDPLTLNGNSATTTIAAPLLGRAEDGWFVEVRGRSGEPLAARTLALSLQPRAFADEVEVTLQTGADGRALLGELAAIDALRCTVPGVGAFAWNLAERRATPTEITVAVGESVLVPAPELTDVGVGHAKLFEVRAGRPSRDVSELLVLRDGKLSIADLAAGDYHLHLAQRAAVVRISVLPGKAQGEWVVGSVRAARRGDAQPLSIQSMALDGDSVLLRLVNAGEAARVHVFATRYLPAFDPRELALPSSRQRYDDQRFAFAPSLYEAGRVLGDELRYVLERRYLQKFPGNMLGKPSLLLNPWSIEDADETRGQGGGEGGRFGGRAGSSGEGRAGGRGGRSRDDGTNAGAFANLDFLAGARELIANLPIGADGTVRVRLADLGPGQHVHAVAVDDDDVDCTSLALALPPLEPRDLRLPKNLDPAQPFAEQQRLEFVAAGASTRVLDANGAKLRPYATIADAHRLLLAMYGGDLAEFAFVTRWPSLSEDERKTLYRDHACHELHLFLWFQDRAWFDRVLKPYLAQKVHKEFLDQWLLGEDVASWLEPARFARLNLVERILLLQRLPGQASALQRLVKEHGELLAVDLDRQAVQFRRALRSGDLDGGTERFTRGLAAAEPNQRPTAGGLPARDDPMAGSAGPATPGPTGPGGGRAAAPPAAAPAPTEAKEKSDRKAELADAENEVRLQLREEVAKQATDKDLAEREKLREFYRDVDRTRIFAESYYWHRTRQNESPDLVAANAYWRDFAAAGGTRIVSPHLAEVGASFTESMFALAVLDLPFAAEAPTPQRDGEAIVIAAKSNLLLARSEVLPVERREGVEPLLVRQSFFRLDERYDTSGTEPRQKSVRGEFLSGVAYGSQVVLTNPTEATRRVSVLQQIPAGAMPLAGAMATWNVPLQLEPYATQRLEFSFYFPRAGRFAHYPATISTDGAFAGAAEAATMDVVDVPTRVDAASWEHVSQAGTEAEVLDYLGKHNLLRVDLSRMLWRLRDRAFFGKAVELLRARFRYDASVWSFGVLHGDRAVTREFLQNRMDVVASLAGPLRSPVLDVDPVEQRSYEHLEFDPLVLARVHRVGVWRSIENGDLAQQWRALADNLCRVSALDSAALVEATYYLLLQGRTEEALATFARVDTSQVGTKLQLDYLAAYLAFTRADVAAARALATPYREHPVERWRLLFGAVLQQCDEIDGARVQATDPTQREAQQTQLAATEPQLDLSVEGGSIVMQQQNLTEVQLRFHRLDVEFAFSNSPFAQQGLAAVQWVEPAKVLVVPVDASQKQLVVPMPADFAQGNVVVEARANGLVRRARSLASSMVVQTVASYGQVDVRSAKGAPLSKVYVKCYTRTDDGRVRFHKDGYTDLRGRFDYASVSERSAGQPARYALLVLSETDGAVLREVDAPNR